MKNLKSSRFGRVWSPGTSIWGAAPRGAVLVVFAFAVVTACSSPSGKDDDGTMPQPTSGLTSAPGTGGLPSGASASVPPNPSAAGTLGNSTANPGVTSTAAPPPSGTEPPPSTSSTAASSASTEPSANPSAGPMPSGTPSTTVPEEAYELPATPPADEDGGSLWLRYPQVSIPGRLAEYRAGLTQVVSGGDAATLKAAEEELVRGLGGLTGSEVPVAAAPDKDGAVVIGTMASSSFIAALPLTERLATLGDEGYLVEATELDGKKIIVVAANSEVGVLYGSFALLRHLQSHHTLQGLSLSAAPKIKTRTLNHWDNLNGSVERGYAGNSLWDWAGLPGTISPRYKEYARANASIGINGTVLTNVNADAEVLTASYLTKVAALADVFRPYGIKVYLTARFSAPSEIGGQSTSDPSNAGVIQWWKDKAEEIYERIPDFGGFLVKANSEGQPGPQTYSKTHADGANVLADALQPFGGIVMWRAFVYSGTSSDRIRQAYEEFHPLDGKFRENVLVQAKNGPLDFQPREPFHPLFGGMPQTPLALEVQVTKEYLGEDTHLAYLGPLYEEVLKADTFAEGAGSTVARIVDGTLDGHATTAMAGVANIGSDKNWTGSHFNQANWYVFGRMAWDPDASAAAIADEWVRQTLSNDPAVVGPVTSMMMASRQALVDYMTPLGLVHIMGSDHHYGPAPWVDNLGQADWNPVYYHKADTQGIGFDRSASGSNAVDQYFDPVKQQFGTRESVPDDLLLFFHHVGWQDELKSGRTMWEELVYRYSLGVDAVGKMRDEWASVEGRIDAKRFADVGNFLQIQHYEARWWRDACLQYFATFSKLPIPSGYAQPANNLAFYQGLTCPSDVKKPRCSQVYTGEPSPAILP